MTDIKIKCLKCNGQMKECQTIKETFSGFPDFPGSEAVTLSPASTRTIEMVDCFKCIECGWSVSK